MSRTGYRLHCGRRARARPRFRPARSRAQDVVKIAAGAPLTGQIAKQGQEVANAVKLAVEDWNKKGGVLGKKIEVLDADDQGNPQVGVAAAEEGGVADPAVMGTVWGITSVTCIPASEVLERSSIVLDSTPGCTNPKVTDRGAQECSSGSAPATISRAPPASITWSRRWA